MKKRSVNYVMRIALAFLWFLAFYGSASAQTGNYLSWNNQVGCISYDSNGEPDNPRKELILLEEIEDAPCVRVCEYSTVNYVMHGTNITNVQWTASGGAITSIGGTANKNATIDWGQAGNGAIDLTIFYSNNTQTSVTLCIEIINGPKPEFSFYGVGNQPVFCIDTEVNFQNLSINNGGSEIVSYYWDFGDGEVSYTFEPSHAYEQPGTYTVRLVVTNNCNCSRSFEMDIHIENKPNVVINCPATVCEYDTVTYDVGNDCGGTWQIEGGTVVNQTATTVEVSWDNVDSEGFGYVSYRSECTCPFWTTIKVPVIINGATIDGPTTLCLNEQGLYTLPQWPSTDFTWTLLPSSPTGTHLVYNDQRNQIIVDALEPGVYELRVSYINTLLGCSGGDKKTITVVEGTVITTDEPAEFCSGSTVRNYTTTSGASVQWELKKNSSIIANTTGVNFDYAFTTGGLYTLTAIAGGCESEPMIINVSQAPAIPTGITGETKYCVGVPYVYTLNNTVPNTILEWTVTNGTIQGSNAGNEITVIFSNTATAAVKVRRVNIEGLGCASKYSTLNVSRLSLHPNITSNSSIYCPSGQSTFTVNLNGVSPDLLEWSIVPADFGNVIAGINSNTVTVSWNEIQPGDSGQGTLRLRVKECNLDQNFDTTITLYQSPALVLTAPEEICYGAPLDLTLAAPGVTSGTIVWDFGNGVTQTTPFNPGGSYSFSPNPYNNTTGSNINQTITATLNNPNGCNYNPSVTDTVLVYPRTIISISPGYNYEVCPTDYTPFVLSANAVTGIGMSVTYKWYKNGGYTGITGSNYTVSGATPQGTYFVRVTDSNNCVVDSQTITVTANCDTPPPCEMPDPELSVTANWTACGTITASASYLGTPASVQWIGSPLITLQSSNNTSATFTTNVPGAHLITVKVTYQTAGGPCTVQETVEVKTHYKPDFNTIVTCNNGGSGLTYNVTLADNSTVFNVTSPITYSFSGPGIPPGTTGQTYNLVNRPPGTYSYTLTVSMAGKPSCAITKQLVLPGVPDMDFSVSSNDVCAEEPIYLTLDTYNPAYTYEWEFFGTSFIASSATTAIQINAPTGQYDVTLKITTPYGCYFESASQPVNVTKAEFDGEYQVTPNINVCEGTPQTISFLPLGSSPTTYIWMKGNQQVGTGSTFVPTSSGVYWVKLFDGVGCQFTETGSVNIIIRPRPYAGITGNTNICYGETGTITGVVTSSTLQRRWLLNGNPMAAPYGTWATNTPLTINVPTGTGTYNYTFEVRPPADTGCGSFATTSVTVHGPVNAPNLSYTVASCEPYKVYVNASGPSAGTYNWSNGMVGQTIMVTTGGALGVTYTAPSGCTASNDIMIPQPLERSLWVFPTGCYDVCYNTSPPPYIIGPLGIFDVYKWFRNGNIVGSGGNSSIAALPVTQGGAYQLTIQNDGCNFESGIMSLVPNDEECDIVACEFKSDVKEDTGYTGGVYLVDGYIQNNTGSPITVTITSFNNYGTYVPGAVTVPAYSTYTFAPVQFIPNSNFSGGDDIAVLQMQGCMTAYKVHFAQGGQQGFAAGARPAALSIVPNPAEELTKISYDLGDSYKQAQSLTVYNLLGNPVFSTKLDKAKGEFDLSIAALPSGTYIVSVQADGVRAIQQTLVKK